MVLEGERFVGGVVRGSRGTGGDGDLRGSDGGQTVALTNCEERAGSSRKNY